MNHSLGGRGDSSWTKTKIGSGDESCWVDSGLFFVTFGAFDENNIFSKTFLLSLGVDRVDGYTSKSHRLGVNCGIKRNRFIKIHRIKEKQTRTGAKGETRG